MNQEDRAALHPGVFIRMGTKNRRPEFNGTPKVRQGTIIAGGPEHNPIKTWDEAKLMKDNLSFELPWNEYYVTGTNGDYKIVEYTGDPQSSRYLPIS